MSDALRQFAREVISRYAWGHSSSDPDGGDIQDLAEKLGLIRNVGFDPARHKDTEGYGLRKGDDWFEFTKLLGGRHAH